jgi:ABC-type uncharacterized transport system permease subunit
MLQVLLIYAIKMCKIYLTPEIAQRVRDAVLNDVYGVQVMRTLTLIISLILLTIQADDVVATLVKLRTNENWDAINIAKVQLLSCFGLMLLYMLLAVDLILVITPILDALFRPFPKHGKLRSDSDTSSSIEEERGNV